MNERMTIENEPELEQDPKIILSGLMQEALARGANDSERHEFEMIFERLDAGEITGEDAVAQAKSILESKQDYH